MKNAIDFSKSLRLSTKQNRFERVGNVNVYRVGVGLEVLDKFLIPLLGFFKARSLSKKNKYNISYKYRGACYCRCSFILE